MYDFVCNTAEDEDDKEDESEACHHVLVTWTGKVTQDGVENFFENKRRCGGGELGDVHFDEDGKEALLKFESPGGM